MSHAAAPLFTIHRWASALGLAEAPLFGPGEDGDTESHRVLLDGGAASFAVSALNGSGPKSGVRSWVWSSDLTHHVGVAEDRVFVSRWDDPAATRAFSFRSVDQKLDAFYRYLAADRPSTQLSVVDHTIDLFRRLRSHVAGQDRGPEAAVHAFLFALACLMAPHGPQAARDDLEETLAAFSIDSRAAETIRRMDWPKFQGLLDHYRQPRGGPAELELLPHLAIRHAGGLIFQEAHYQLLSAAPPDLFGFAPLPIVRVDTRGATHFTPPSLARSVVEQALRGLRPLDQHPILKVHDPACGSGSFLYETLRVLRREGYRGRVMLIGRDISLHAVAMARFTLSRACAEWQDGVVEIDVQAVNSLADQPWPVADMVVMNPPFISWPDMTTEQRDEVRETLGPLYSGKADYSMAFVARALKSLRSGGVLGTLVPASLLSSMTAAKWRRHLLDEATPTFIGFIGDHSLFRHALVQIAAAVFAKEPGADTRDRAYVALWTSEAPDVAGDAMRALRRADGDPSAPVHGGEWRVSRESTKPLLMRMDWRPRPNRLAGILEQVRSFVTTTVADLFNVRQGVRTGANEIFLAPSDYVCAMPDDEQRFFRPALLNRDVSGGRIFESDFIFFPYTTGLPQLLSEANLREYVPRFYEDRLLPNKEQLARRADIARRTGPSAQRWWDLSQARPWQNEPTAKLVTAYFGRAGSFAWDEHGKAVIVQGHGWTPTKALEHSTPHVTADGDLGFSPLFFAAYAALLNSRLFTLLLGEFCNHVAGGQYDLSKRFVDNIPLPNLPMLAQDKEKGFAVAELDRIGVAASRGSAVASGATIDELVGLLYAVAPERWPQA